MRQFATVKVGQVAARYGEHAPAAATCCNACRTCVTANLTALSTAFALAAWRPILRLGRRLADR